MEEDLKAVRAAAYRLLNRRWYSVYQLQEKLRQKKFPLSQIALITEELLKDKFLDDRRFAALWIEEKKSSLGRKRIISELKLKGIEKDIIIAELNNYTEEEEEKAAKVLAKGRFSSYLQEEKEKRQQRLGNFLLRRGFSTALAWKTINWMERTSR